MKKIIWFRYISLLVTFHITIISSQSSDISSPLQELDAIESEIMTESFQAAEQLVAELEKLFTHLLLLLEHDKDEQNNERICQLLTTLFTSALEINQPSEPTNPTTAIQKGIKNAEPAYNDNQSTQVVLSTFTQIANEFALIISNPHDKPQISKSLANIFVGILKMAQETTRKMHIAQ